MNGEWLIIFWNGQVMKCEHSSWMSILSKVILFLLQSLIINLTCAPFQYRKTSQSSMLNQNFINLRFDLCTALLILAHQADSLCKTKFNSTRYQGLQAMGTAWPCQH